MRHGAFPCSSFTSHSQSFSTVITSLLYCYKYLHQLPCEERGCYCIHMTHGKLDDKDIKWFIQGYSENLGKSGSWTCISQVPAFL